jgi:hypothetical protein
MPTSVRWQISRGYKLALATRTTASSVLSQISLIRAADELTDPASQVHAD